MSALANALRAALSPVVLAAIAQRACVTRRQASMARAGKPINAGAYLALCGAIGVDPTDGSPRQIKTVSANVLWRLLSASLDVTRSSRRLDQRARCPGNRRVAVHCLPRGSRQASEHREPDQGVRLHRCAPGRLHRAARLCVRRRFTGNPY